MPKIDFSTEYAPKKTNYQFPRTRLENGEKARINAGLGDVEMEYVHNLEKPLLENGEPVYHELERRDGTKYTAVKREWVSNPISLGDFGILSDKGVDPQNCIISKFAMKHPEWVKPPHPRYAINVIRYRTKPGSFNVMDPFSVEALVWAFGPKKFDTLIELKQEWDKLGGFKKHDLLLGPCTNKGFQQFDINVSSEAAWDDNEDFRKLTLDTYELNKVEDLSLAIGRRKDEAFIQMDLDQIAEAWGQVQAFEARNSGTTYDLGSASTALDNDLSSLLDDEPKEEKKAPAKKAAKPVEETAVAEETDNDFDDLLAGLEDDE